MKLTPEKHLSKVDPKFGELIKIVNLPVQRKSRRTHFEALVEAIVSQQLSVKAADTIFFRFVALFDKRQVGKTRAARAKFPKPEHILKMKDTKLREVGLSYQKISYIKDLATKVLSTDLKLNTLSRLDNEAVVAELIKVKGIGRWTAEMFLMFSLVRPDVFSAGDLGLRNAIIKLYKLKKPPTEKQLERITKKWSPHRTTASRYLWKSLNNK